MQILVLTSDPDVRAVLPGLDLLPHPVRACRPSVQEFLSAGWCDVVLVDGRTQPFAACELSRGLVATARGIPVIGVIEELVASQIDEDCAVVQLVLASAGPAEIDARLRLAGRRRVVEPGPAAAAVLAVGPFVLDVHAWSVTVDGAPLALTHHEFELLKVLLLHAGRPLTRAQLVSECDGWTDGTGPRAVDCHIRAIRAKLGRHRGLVRTVRGHGYVLPRLPPGASEAGHPAGTT
ncbi:winged helix-turn-helix domain-containing protein [Pseudonocardia kujensis]|uniref:winged helix-turn-helix domain-containing protein n=1 Tax=Pseudonocardia kujensis TaxID=1128675 RepID=UPI001E52C38C|nr:winged helix-turn-helix domain-containing protein [Pseudonocardia kujensis]MCE0763772.1 winged helix-turn-helix domain-containing protein [Pseudonocardia kujensis]